MIGDPPSLSGTVHERESVVGLASDMARLVGDAGTSVSGIKKFVNKSLPNCQLFKITPVIK